jgi:hypothetical protein
MSAPPQTPITLLFTCPWAGGQAVTSEAVSLASDYSCRVGFTGCIVTGYKRLHPTSRRGELCLPRPFLPLCIRAHT